MKGKELHSSKRLSIKNLQCQEISQWVLQYPERMQITVKSILLHLEFISRDQYSEWLKLAVSEFPSEKKYSLYSVRKLNKNSKKIWNEEGETIDRPGASQGSEDFVCSLISNIIRDTSENNIFDHSSINDLRKNKIRDIILIDDSIGSGSRITIFINAMLSHSTFLSWWSFGWITLHIVSYARQREAENKIIANVRGSNKYNMKCKKSSKISFTSARTYSLRHLDSRWGRECQEILKFCESRTAILKKYRKGYGDVMANLVFFHSVPNNIPGIMWFQNNKNNALFPNRSFPNWLISILNSQRMNENIKEALPVELVSMLKLVKMGIRSVSSIALRLNCDNNYANLLMTMAMDLKLVSERKRLSKFGFDLLKNPQNEKPLSLADRSLYIPSSWCADQSTVQPSVSSVAVCPSNGLERQADSDQKSSCEDGKVG